MTETFPQRLERMRTARNLTKQELALRIGAADRSIGHWERAERVPSAEHLAHLADAFGVTLDYLWRGPKRRRRGS